MKPKFPEANMDGRQDLEKARTERAAKHAKKGAACK